MSGHQYSRKMLWRLASFADLALAHWVGHASDWVLRLTFSFARLDLSSVATTCSFESPCV